MAQTNLANLVKMSVSGAPGTGTITFGSVIPSYLTPAQAGLTDGLLVVYEAFDGTNREVGTATYSSGAGTLSSRSVTNSTNGNAACTLTANTIVALTARKEDFINKTGDTMTGVLTTLASSSVAAGFNVPSGTAPTSPGNGDVWQSTAAYFAQNAGGTHSFSGTNTGDQTVAASSDILTATSTTTLIPPKSLFTASAPVTISPSSAITLDFATFINGTIQLTTANGNVTFASPSNLLNHVGQSGFVSIIQSTGGGQTLTFNALFKFAGGGPTASTGVSARDVMSYAINSTSLVLCSFMRGFST